MLKSLPTEQIARRADARPIVEEVVKGLMESIVAGDLINPIRVRPVGDGWEATAGGHRLEAHKRLGLAEITCDVREEDDRAAELAMIDENVFRGELSAVDRARFLARRKELYLAEHPDNRTSQSSQNLGTVPAPRFTQHVAEATGQSEKAVQLDVERGNKVLDEVLDLIRGTSLDTGVYLDKLKKLPGNEQYRAAKRDMAAERQRRLTKAKPKIVRVADAPLDDEDAQERQVAALMSAWNKSSAEARAEFLDRIGAEQIARAA